MALSNGLRMPLLGLGTGGIMDIQRVATEAMDMGYGLLNTGENYGNNEALSPPPETTPAYIRRTGTQEIGLALQATKVPRDRVWLTTKASN